MCNRDVAIDYCMGKGVYERTNAEGEVVMEGDEGEEEAEGDIRLENEEEGDEEEDGEEGDGENEEEEGDDEEVDDDDNEDDDDDDEEDEDEEEEEKGGKKKEENDLEDVVEGCTVFLRDLPYDADHRDLRKVTPLIVLHSCIPLRTLSYKPSYIYTLMLTDLH